MVTRAKSRRSTRRKAPKRKAPKRKPTKKKAAPKRKAPKRKAKTPRKPKYSLLITQSQRNSRDFKVVVLKNGKVTGEPKKIIASKISSTTSNIIKYAQRKRINLSKAWNSVT